MNFQRFESELTVNKKGKASIGTLKFSGDITIQEAVAITESLLNAFSKVDNCKLDLDLVNLFDLSSIQILFAAHKSALIQKKGFELAGACPKIFKNAVSEAGFDRIDWLCFGD